jgi:hypothetical protein
MATDWRRFCRPKDLVVDGAEINVQLAEGRHHVIAVGETDECLQLVGIITRQAATAAIPDLLQTIWGKNRTTQLVGFRVDRKGRLVGETLVPRAGLEADEFQLCARTLAAECDRMEYLLTGKDVE